jgi:heptosyltransferase-2
MNNDPENLLIVLPSWLGDVVMATPTLRALRNRFPDARISYVLRRNLRPICAGMPWADRLITYRHGTTPLLSLAARLRSGQFDAALLMPNSFKSALLCKLARIPRIIGYDRDARGMLLLDDRLPVPNRRMGRFVPTPMIDYYLGLAEHFNASLHDRRMELFVTAKEQSDAARIQNACQLNDANRPWIFMNPGANFGSAKIWPLEYFAQISDRLCDRLGATVLLSTAPRERPIADRILELCKNPVIDLQSHRPSLGSLKEIIRRCDLMITNDTGPRHIAAAFGVPVITLFGPTDPNWTRIDFDLERQLSVPVECGPCQLKKCPLDHRCMTRLRPDLVWPVVVELLRKPGRLSVLRNHPLVPVG